MNNKKYYIVLFHYYLFLHQCCATIIIQIRYTTLFNHSKPSISRLGLLFLRYDYEYSDFSPGSQPLHFTESNFEIYFRQPFNNYTYVDIFVYYRRIGRGGGNTEQNS
jgi:hypothetical protein